MTDMYLHTTWSCCHFFSSICSHCVPLLMVNSFKFNAATLCFRTDRSRKKCIREELSPGQVYRLMVSSLILFVPDGDISSSLQEQLADAWMTHLSCQHQRSPSILNKRQIHKELQSTHLYARGIHKKSLTFCSSHLKARKEELGKSSLQNSGHWQL